MKKTIILSFVLLFALGLQMLSGLELYTHDGKNYQFSLEKLRISKLDNFTTTRVKHEKKLVENWQGLNLQSWMEENKFTDFQSLRFESADNYMVRIHKVELDSMRGFIVLKKDGALLDSREIRIIFPAHRDMYWVRGVAKIFLEDFKPTPPPHQIFIWDAEKPKLILHKEPKPFAGIEGYYIDELMAKLFYQDTGSVVIVSRDGLKSRLEYPKHLQGSVLE